MSSDKTVGGLLTEIADILREEVNDQKYKLEMMPGAIRALGANNFRLGKEEGTEHGYVLGEEAGYSSGLTEGIEQGKQAEYDAFWDAYQENGTRYKYEYAFAGHGWNDETFKPKYNLILGLGHTGTTMFWGCKVSNMAETLEKQGARLDTTLCGNASAMFQNAAITRLPELNFSHAQDYNSNGLYVTFANSTVKTIDKLIVPEQLKYNSTFNGCSNLEDITFEGVIGNNISFANSPLLTTESVQSVIDHLKDLTGATAQTLTFHATVGGNLTDAQKAAITAKNWTLVY